MNKCNLAWVSAIVLAVVSLGLNSVNAGTDAQRIAVTKAIEKAPVTELAAKAAGLVSKSTVAERESMAVTAVEQIVSKHPAVAASVVGAIAKAAPEVAAAAAAKAASLNPAQAASIARAATLAAPKYAVQIAKAVVKAAPKSAVAVAQAVMNAAPNVSTQVAEAVVAVAPQTISQLKQPTVRPLAGTLGLPSVTSSGNPINNDAPLFQERTTPEDTGGHETAGADDQRPAPYGSP